MFPAMKSANVKLNEPMKDDASLVKWKWNLDMNVTVSNVKNSKIIHRIYVLFILILAIFSVFTYSYFKREVEVLRAKVDYMNFLVLVSKHDKFNRSLNRGSLHQSTHSSNHHDSINSIKSTIREFSDLSKVYRNHRIINITPMTSYSNQTDSPDAHKVNISAISNVTTSYMRFLNGSNVEYKSKRNFLRSTRALLTFETQNLTVTKNQTVSNDVLNVEREPRLSRLRRDEGRGKKQRQKRRRPKRSRGRLGPLMATFIGAIPEQHIKDTVYIGPWIKNNRNNSQYDFTKFHLVEDKMSIEVTISGLYMISVQIFYFGDTTNYSYWILLHPEGSSITQKLSKCATASSNTVAEVSCYTSVVTYLQRGDRLRVQQQEKNRFINMREGYSHIQLILLSDNKRKKQNYEF